MKTTQKIVGRRFIGLVIISVFIALTGFIHAQVSTTPVQNGGDSLRGVNVDWSSVSDLEVKLQVVEMTTPLPAESAPSANNYYSAQNPFWPPLPGNPNGLPIWPLGEGTYLLDDRQFDYSAYSCAQARTMSAMDVPSPGDDGDSGNGNFDQITDTRRNYTKFANQVFQVIDTNSAAANDTNLYKVCASIPNVTNSTPRLQIAPYGANAIVIKASHFNFSGETRDFALLVCDKVETPVWKTIDFAGVSDSQDGWLVQCTVANWQVADPMFFMVTNVAHDCNAFFRAIPYGGPQVSFNGVPQPNDTVSNTITLNAQILDLSGVTNDQFEVTVDGLAARYTLSASNTINLDTRYNNAGIENVYLNVFNKNAQICNPTNPPDDTRLLFSGTATLPLDFENDTYLAFASDYCSPNVGVNYIYFVINKAQEIEASITDPADGHLVAYFYGYVPYPATVSLPWNFTEADGVTPYTNDTYVVTFTAFDPATLTVTNKIDRGVRAGAGCFLTYEEEDPSTNTGSYLNQQADIWINQTLVSLYQDMYEWWSITWYDTTQVGENRDWSACTPMTKSTSNWESFMKPALANSSSCSDLTIAQGHGSGATIGGGPYISDKFTPMDLQRWILGTSASVGANWRLRKAALWTCYSGDIAAQATAGGMYSSFPDACGIHPGPLQEQSYMRKNCGLFFGGLLPQGGFGGGTSATTAQVAEALDQTWVCGMNQYPGGCDPTYSFRFAVNATRGMYNPKLDKGDPRLFGYKYMIYSSVYDDELMMLNNSHVKY